MYRKLLIIVVILLVLVTLFACGPKPPQKSLPIYVYYPEDSVSFHRVDTVATLCARENAELKKQNKRLRWAIIGVAGLGWGFTILKAAD
jgi:predicted small lipoprotein YifL